MNLLPNIYGTIVNYPFQGSMADTSGHGLSLSTLDAFSSAPGGTEQYGTLDSCLQGFKFDGGTKMIAPLSTALQVVGPWTMQWLMYQPTTIGGGQSWFCLCDPARNGSPDRIGSIWTFFWGNLTPGPHPYWADLTHGSNLPVPGGAWWTTADTSWGAAVHHISVRYVPVAGVGIFIDLFLDGVKQTPNTAQPMSTSFETVTGVERFYVGGCDGGGQTPVANSLIAGLRMVNYGRSDAQILADAQFALSATCSLTPSPPVTDPSTAPLTSASGTPGLVGPAVTASLYRYAPKSYGDRFFNPGD